MPGMHHVAVGLLWFISVFALLFGLAVYCSAVGGRWLTRAPVLDVIVALFTIIPWFAGAIFSGRAGLIGAVLAEPLVLVTWSAWHEMLHRDAAAGPRIVKFINRTAGRWQNHVALWVTAVALPGFWGIRVMEILCYWPLVKLLNFPPYRQSDWINVSRQKFDGLVGHDLIWCLYCDWMTGVYSLGAEMLRNVESFWCPIRYYDGKKCDHCSIEFPDINNGWAKASGTMGDVEKIMEDQYAAGNRSWFGHPSRTPLTVKGQPIEIPPG